MENQDKLDLIIASDSFNHLYEKISFVTGETTKDQYLAFKNYIKTRPYGAYHYEYVAYYAFKHRIPTIDLDDYLNNAVIKCWKMLYTGQNSCTYGGGGECMKYEAIPNFKKKVMYVYNKFKKGEYYQIGDKVEIKKD